MRRAAAEPPPRVGLVPRPRRDIVPQTPARTPSVAVAGRVIPAASSAGRYRAWGWRGGHAQNQGLTSGQVDVGRVIGRGRWYDVSLWHRTAAQTSAAAVSAGSPALPRFPCRRPWRFGRPGSPKAYQARRRLRLLQAARCPSGSRPSGWRAAAGLPGIQNGCGSPPRRQSNAAATMALPRDAAIQGACEPPRGTGTEARAVPREPEPRAIRASSAAESGSDSPPARSATQRAPCDQRTSSAMN